MWHMEVPRLRAELELQLSAYTTATATQDPSNICNLHHSSQQCCIPDPLSEARDQTLILMDTSRIRFNCATMRTPTFFKIFFSIMVYHRILNVVPCALQWDFVGCPSYIDWFASANPKLPVLPSLTETPSQFSVCVRQFSPSVRQFSPFVSSH